MKCYPNASAGITSQIRGEVTQLRSGGLKIFSARLYFGLTSIVKNYFQLGFLVWLVLCSCLGALKQMPRHHRHFGGLQLTRTHPPPQQFGSWDKCQSKRMGSAPRFTERRLATRL